MDRDISGLPDGKASLQELEWEALPYGCVGIARSTRVEGADVWSWLVLVPWSRDSKPWIDGTEIITDPVPEKAQRERVLGRMREILDERYGATVAERAADRMLDEFNRGD